MKLKTCPIRRSRSATIPGIRGACPNPAQTRNSVIIRQLPQLVKISEYLKAPPLSERRTGAGLLVCFNLYTFQARNRALSHGTVCTPAKSPVPKQYLQFKKDVWIASLNAYGVMYRNYPEFGARQSNPSFYTEAGYLDFERYICSDSL